MSQYWSAFSELMRTPFLHLELVWGIVPLYFGLLLNEMTSSKASFRTAIQTGFSFLWGGTQWLYPYFKPHAPGGPRLELGDAAGESLRDFPGSDTWRGGIGQRDPAKVSDLLRFPGPYALCELLHDRDLSNPGALFGMEMELPDRHRALRGSDLVGLAFWTDADQESKISLREDCCHGLPSTGSRLFLTAKDE
jgi:hypothetical protein